MRDIYITRNCWPEKEKLKLFYVFYVLVFDFRSHRASDFRRLYAIDIFHDMCVCVSVPECACVCLFVSSARAFPFLLVLRRRLAIKEWAMGCSQLPGGPHTNHLHRGRWKKNQIKKKRKRGKLRKQQQQQALRIGIHNEARLMIILKIHKATRLWNWTESNSCPLNLWEGVLLVVVVAEWREG